MKQRVAVIVCLYNTLELVKRCLDAAWSRSSSQTKFILVDNHGPDAERIRQYVGQFPMERVQVVDPGKNLGCHGGWNAGWERVKSQEFTHVVKLDDDTVIITANWDALMAQALDDVPDLGYLSADIDAKQNNRYLKVERNGHMLEVPDQGIVGFSCVMFRTQDIAAWGPMRNAGFLTAERKAAAETSLYGGEEVYYATLSKQSGKFFAHFPAVFCHHLGNENRHPDYPMWKWVHGYMGWTQSDMLSWLAGDMVATHYRKRVVHEMHAQVVNVANILYCVQRLADLGGLEDLSGIRLISDRSDNLELKCACAMAESRIRERANDRS